MAKFHSGQRCMIVQSEGGNLGRIVTLVHYIGSLEGFKYDRYWSIQETIGSLLGVPINVAYEDQLMPLDGAQANNACTGRVDTSGSQDESVLEPVPVQKPLSRPATRQ